MAVHQPHLREDREKREVRLLPWNWAETQRLVDTGLLCRECGEVTRRGVCPAHD